MPSLEITQKRTEGLPSVLCFLLFDFRLAGKDGVDLFRRELGNTVISIQTVLLLLDVGELGIAQPADTGMIQKDTEQYVLSTILLGFAVGYLSV